MRFRITWREGAYYVDVPEYEGGDVVTIDEFDNLERSWQIEAQAAHDRGIECERLRAALVDAREAIASVHHGGFDSSRQEIATAGVRAITDALNHEKKPC